MDILTWGRTPWGEWMLTHISWDAAETDRLEHHDPQRWVARL
jgi:hypothetical protein